jgi:hypothetical protein
MVFSFFNRWSSFLMYKERGVNVFSASARFVIALFSNAFGRDGARDFGAWRWHGSCAAAIAAAAATSAFFAACKIKNRGRQHRKVSVFCSVRGPASQQQGAALLCVVGLLDGGESDQ